jgi:transcriptional regulator with XRE-family HTH domain
MVEGDVYPEKLMGPNESAPRQSSIGPLTGQDAGGIVRAARLVAGLTLADLGRRCGYSASQVSRYERGIQPLTDITLLRRFSQVLAIPPQVFGLTPPDGSQAGRHAVDPKDGDPRVAWPRVSREPQWEDGEDPMRRRELLAGAAGWSAPQHSACRRSAAAGRWPILALALKTCCITVLPTPNPSRSPHCRHRDPRRLPECPLRPQLRGQAAYAWCLRAAPHPAGR